MVATLNMAGRLAIVMPHGVLFRGGSVFTTLLVARKVLENWLYWVVIDAGAAVLYAAQGLHATAALFILYSLLAVRGYVRWRHNDAAATHAVHA